MTSAEQLAVNVAARSFNPSEDLPPFHTPGWKGARRGKLTISHDSIDFLDWHLLQSDIERIVLFTPTNLLFPPLKVYRVYTQARVYDFQVSDFRSFERFFRIPVEKRYDSFLSKKTRLVLSAVFIILILLMIALQALGIRIPKLF